MSKEGIQMPRIEEGIEIRCPVEKAYAFTTDAGGWNTWQTIILEAEQTSQGPVGVGTTFKGASHLMGRTVQWTARATECKPPGKFGKNITSGPLLIEQHNTYTPTTGGMKFTLTYDVTVNGFQKVLTPLMVNSMRKELQKSLINLKQILESESGI